MMGQRESVQNGKADRGCALNGGAMVVVLSLAASAAARQSGSHRDHGILAASRRCQVADLHKGLMTKPRWSN
jgi:hypothetical protein